MPAPVILPVAFADRSLAYDLARLPPLAHTLLSQLRAEVRRDGGLPAARVRRCDPEGRDGTRLPNCVKVYLPEDENKWGLVLLARRVRDRPLVFVAFAYGLRHPTGTSASVYRIADRRLHAADSGS